jgi:hypothetical protein
MRRLSSYVGQQVYEWGLSSPDQNTMVALAKVCSAMFGTSGIVNGLACTATSPASMSVQIGAGEIYQMAQLEATACGTLPADTAHTILKQGIQLGTYTTSAFAAPLTSGQSINYLIEAQYQDSDISLDPTSGASNVVLQFYNAANPTSPWSGPANSGTTSNTFRDGIVAYQIKSGGAATTGTQATPSPDTGWIGLWVVTVAYGQTSITSANIAQYAGAPVLSADLLTQIGARALLGGSSSQLFNVAAAAASANAVNLGQFPATLAGNGCIVIPVIVAGVKQNLIVQWLNGVSASSGIMTQAWPITFPNAVLSFNSSYLANGSALAATTACPSTNTTNSTCIVNVATASSVAVPNANVKVIAVGW